MSSVPVSFFVANRRTLLEKLDGLPYVVSAYRALQKKADQAHVFSQEANFWYLSGVTTQDWRLIVEPNGDSWLVAPVRDEVQTIFEGALPLETIRADSGVTGILNEAESQAVLKRLAATHSTVATIFDDPHEAYGFVANSAHAELMNELRTQFDRVVDCRRQLARLRALKQPWEIECIRHAVDVTIRAFSDVHDRLSTFKAEYEIEAAFNQLLRSQGARGHAYEPIVASGINACTLHYGTNNDQLRAPGLVLIDIGAELNQYNADITRTYAYGEIDARTQEVHMAVERAHHDIIVLIAPGVNLAEYQKKAETRMRQALQEVGLIRSDDASDVFRRYFPHAISHGLGLDVHESLGGYDVFMPGMVLTVEPGIYIPEEKIGVRIEDDILVVEQGNDNLSASLPTSL